MNRLPKINRIASVAGLLILCFMILSLSVRSSPINGSSSDFKKIGSSAKWSMTRTFRGGERAAVLALPASDEQKEPGIKLHVAVYDAKGALIAEDNGESEPAGDFVGLVWYPPRDGDYLIEVSHTAGGVNNIYVAIK